MPNSISQDTFSLLRKDFDFPEQVGGYDEEQLITFLSKTIRQMLDRDFERLLQICYRIDLGENKLKKILHESEPDQIASDLAAALWHRQKQKIELRRKYSSS
ncbi:hypothetical protein [Algoriphagus halophytocola]|uniref:DivIVA domain-containing protein n=1 Tax=Algoriphagus halophytocola TaxID=2991499 RepID=A0ABY6MDT4_9BACT|nr:hypothetical protein [Algoriphagus sp. TR-M5]UZD21055.1 hypothetical protein OM944_10245 [Algoriphagus sp. TR-M5]